MLGGGGKPLTIPKVSSWQVRFLAWVWMDEWIVDVLAKKGWMDGWMDGRVGGWLDEWMDG